MLDEQLGEEAFKGNMRKVEELLSMGANVNASLSNGFTPLHNVHFVKYDGPVVKS